MTTERAIKALQAMAIYGHGWSREIETEEWKLRTALLLPLLPTLPVQSELFILHICLKPTRVKYQGLVRGDRFWKMVLRPKHSQDVSLLALGGIRPM
jgi:hypothetical protein